MYALRFCKLIFLKAWATYFLGGSLKGKDPQTASQVFDNTDKFTGASGFGLGIGYSFLPLVFVNLEYRSLEYSTYKINGVDAGSAYSEKLNLNSLIVSVSVPLDL